jgi:hypothetical protein
MRALWALHPVKGHAVSQVMAPGDVSKCHRVGNQEAFTGLCICSCREDHSTPGSWLSSPTECVLTEICQKTTPPLTPQTKKGPNKTSPLCKQQGATDFLVSLSVSRGSFSFLSNKSYFVCWPCCLMSQSAASWANSLAHGGKNSQHWPTTQHSPYGHKMSTRELTLPVQIVIALSPDLPNKVEHVHQVTANAVVFSLKLE